MYYHLIACRLEKFFLHGIVSSTRSSYVCGKTRLSFVYERSEVGQFAVSTLHISLLTAEVICG
jgi:hypothetical protein